MDGPGPHCVTARRCTARNVRCPGEAIFSRVGGVRAQLGRPAHQARRGRREAPVGGVSTALRACASLENTRRTQGRPRLRAGESCTRTQCAVCVSARILFHLLSTAQPRRRAIRGPISQRCALYGTRRQAKFHSGAGYLNIKSKILYPSEIGQAHPRPAPPDTNSSEKLYCRFGRVLCREHS